MAKLSVGIIGGGIGGVTAAIALRQFGFDATVYERAAELREVGAGMMLWANATRVLSELGLLERILAVSGRTNFFEVHTPRGDVLMKIATGKFEVPSVCVRRADLLAVLVDSLPAEILRLNCEFQNLEQTENKVRVFFKDGKSVEHDLLIGADGVNSLVRGEIFGHFAPIYHGYQVWRGIAHYEGKFVSPFSSSETWGKDSRFGILSTGHDDFTWYATANLSADFTDAPERRKDELLARFGGWHRPIADLIAATPDGKILRNPAFDHTPMKKWVRGRVALLGDAAHTCTPNLGQGGGMAIEDALVLAKSLHREKSIAAALALYENRRTSRTRHIQQRSRLMGSIAQWENPLIVTGRRLVTNILPANLFEFNLRRTYSYRA